MRKIKEVYLIFVIVIGLFSLSIYSTYALFTEEYVVGSLDINTLTYDIELSDIMEYKRVDTYSNNDNIITLNILNPTSKSIYYGIYTNSLDECIDINHDNTSSNVRDIIDSGISKTINIKVSNTCSYNFSFNLYILTSDVSFNGKDEIDSKYVIKSDSDIEVITKEDSNDIDNNDNVEDNTLISRINYLYNSGNVIDDYNDMVGLMKDKYNNIRYYGGNPNNYISFNNELWRIIGLFDNKVKIIRNDSIDNYVYSNSGNNWKNSNIMKSLNPNFTESNIYWNNLDSKYTSMLSINNFYLGGIKETNLTSEDLYDSERDTDIVWKGYLGLMYPSDYAYSRDNRLCTDVTNICDSYLSSNIEEYTISSIKDSNDKIFGISNNGNYDLLSTSSLSIRPVGYLNKDIIVISGSGTSDNPYEIDLK